MALAGGVLTLGSPRAGGVRGGRASRAPGGSTPSPPRALVLRWQVHAFRVGGAERWEFLLAGDVCRQVAEAEVHAAKVETVVSPEAWRRAPWISTDLPVSPSISVYLPRRGSELHCLTLTPVPPTPTQAGVRSLRGGAPGRVGRGRGPRAPGRAPRGHARPGRARRERGAERVPRRVRAAPVATQAAVAAHAQRRLPRGASRLCYLLITPNPNPNALHEARHPNPNPNPNAFHEARSQ